MFDNNDESHTIKYKNNVSSNNIHNITDMRLIKTQTVILIIMLYLQFYLFVLLKCFELRCS